MEYKENKFKIGDRVTYGGTKYKVVDILSSGQHLNYCLLEKLTGHNIGHIGSYWDEMLEIDLQESRNQKIKSVLGD